MKNIIALLFTAIIFLANCGSSNGPLAGGGSPSPNAIVGKVTGTAAATVLLYKIEGDISSDTATLVWSVLRNSTTDDSGRYRFDSLPDGYYAVNASKNSLSDFAGYITLDSSNRFHKYRDMLLEPEKNISGHITDSSGKPLAAIIGMVGTRFTDTTSEIDGSFSFESLPASPLQFQLTPISRTSNMNTSHGLFLFSNAEKLQGSMSISGNIDSDTLVIDSALSSIRVPWIIGDNHTQSAALSLDGGTFTYRTNNYLITYVSKQ